MKPPAALPESGGPTGRNPITVDGPLLPVILSLAAPSVLMMYLQNAYNIIDTIWVGRLLGKVPLAGIATGGYVLWCLFGLVALISVGLTAIVARRVGQERQAEAARVAGRGLRYTLVWSVVVAGGVWLFLDPIFDVMGAEGEIRAQGMDYIQVLLIGAPLLFLSFSIGAIYRAAGDTVTPMWLMALSLVINSGLDPVLMLGLGGLPRMGIAGAALATVIARSVWVVMGLALLARGKRIGGCGPGWRKLVPCFGPGPLTVPLFAGLGWGWRQLAAMARIGAPHSVSMVLFPVTYMILVRIPADYGAHQVAALRIGHTVEGMSFFLAIGVSLATATLVGQCLGAKRPDRAARFAWATAWLTVAVLAMFSVAFYWLAEPIAAVFNPAPDTISAGATYLRILSVSQVFMGLEIVLGGGFNGSGHTVPPMAVAVPWNLARIPLAYWLVSDLGWGITGVWWAISATSIIKGALVAGWFGLGSWKRRQV